MNTAKRIATVTAAIIIFALGALTAIAFEHHDTPTVTTASTSVSSYDDGFATSKQDDCQQGDPNACAWLGQAAHPAASAYDACVAYVGTQQLASDICEPLSPGACTYYAAHHYPAPDYCTKSSS